MTEYDDDETQAEGDEYEVGYGKPPKHTRYKKGQSGNPKRGKNRPKTFLRHFEEAMEKKATVVINGQTVEMPRIAIAAENLALKATKAEKAGVQLLLETSKADLRDQRLQVENQHLREKLKKLGLEYEKLKEQKQGGLLALPDPAVNELEFEMLVSPPEEVLERIKQHPEELEDMIRKKYERNNGK